MRPVQTICEIFKSIVGVDHNPCSLATFKQVHSQSFYHNQLLAVFDSTQVSMVLHISLSVLHLTNIPLALCVFSKISKPSMNWINAKFADSILFQAFLFSSNRLLATYSTLFQFPFLERRTKLFLTAFSDQYCIVPKTRCKCPRIPFLRWIKFPS